VVKAVAEIFRAQQGLRESRERARLKYLFLKEGWTAESFLAELQARLDFKLLPGAPEQVPNDIFRDARGRGGATAARPQFRGRHGSARPALRRSTRSCRYALAEQFGSGALRTTVSQNLLFIDVPTPRQRRSLANWARSVCKSKARPSGAAPSPAPAPSSASWPLPRPRALPAGS